MSKFKAKSDKKYQPYAVPNYQPTSPPPVGFEGIHSTKVVLEEILPPLKKFSIDDGPHHTSVNEGGSAVNRGHRVTGPLTQEVYQLLDHKYLRYYGYLDGVLRFLYLHSEMKYRNILEQFLREFLTVMQDGGDLDGLSPKNWKSGRFLALFRIINELNRRRDDLTCPLNDLALIRALKPDHPRYKDACEYLKFYQNNSVFGHVSNKFYQLVKVLAKDIRQYDVSIHLKNHTFGYRIKKGFCDSVGDLMKRTALERVTRITALEEYFDKQKFLDFVRKQNVEIVYVDNLRVLYFDIPAMPFFDFRVSDDSKFVESNLFEFVAHDYKRIGNGFYSANNAESDAMELIRNNALTMECHIRPRYNKFYLKMERTTNTNTFNILLSIGEKRYVTIKDLNVAYDQVTFFGAIIGSTMVLTDVVRLNDREVNADITRADYDFSENNIFTTSNLQIRHVFDDGGAYDLVLRCEYGVFRARSIVKHRIYDPVTWFHDYLESFGVEKFDSLYRVKCPKLEKLLAAIRANIKDRIKCNDTLRKDHSGFNEMILYMDNRYVPPLIVSVKKMDNPPKIVRGVQYLNGDLYQLNKYYVLSKSGTKCFSIDPPQCPFSFSYQDEVFEYFNNPVALNVTTFARFPDNWSDEIYDDGVLDYRKFISLEQRSAEISLMPIQDHYSEIQIYQPYHHTVESEFISNFANLKIDMKEELLVKKKGKRRYPKGKFSQ